MKFLRDAQQIEETEIFFFSLYVSKSRGFTSLDDSLHEATDSDLFSGGQANHSPIQQFTVDKLFGKLFVVENAAHFLYF